MDYTRELIDKMDNSLLRGTKNENVREIPITIRKKDSEKPEDKPPMEPKCCCGKCGCSSYEGDETCCGEKLQFRIGEPFSILNDHKIKRVLVSRNNGTVMLTVTYELSDSEMFDLLPFISDMKIVKIKIYGASKTGNEFPIITMNYINDGETNVGAMNILVDLAVNDNNENK